VSFSLVKPEPATLLAVGIVCCTLSALYVFGRKIHILLFAGLIGAASALPLAVLHFALDMPVNFQWGLPVAVGLSVLIILARSNVFAYLITTGANSLKRPACVGMALFIAGVGMLAYATSESDPPDFDELVQEFDVESRRDYQPFAGHYATTDRGNNVPLIQITNAKFQALERTDRRLVETNVHRECLIRVTEPSALSNCHGWVFSGGLCWISNDSIELILLENDYQQVDLPLTDDLVIYRDTAGKIIHTGVVRAIWTDGRILVESKWGALGVFLHFVEHSAYGDHWTFHHTRRPSHALKGLPQSGGGASTGFRQKEL
jgi:hypothetical protein